MPLTDFQLEKELGKGAFATVYRCRRLIDDRVYAMKKICIANLPAKDRINALNEVRILASVNGPNVVEYKEAFYDEESACLCIVMEYADGGDLMSQIVKHRENNTIFEEKQIWKTAYDILKGLKVLHGFKILHRDIKSANIFLSNGQAKIGDLNISKLVQNEMATTQTGTPYYTCPQVWKDEPYGFKGDVWSLGCVIYEMCMLKPPFRAQQFEGLYQKVISGQFQKISFVYSSNLNLFISRCLTVDQAKRASVDQLLNSHFFKDFRETPKRKKAAEADCNGQMLGTIQFPENLVQINNLVPEPQYDKRERKKPKTVMITEPKDNVEMRQVQNQFMHTASLSLKKSISAKSEKQLPPVILPNDSKSHRIIGQRNVSTPHSPPKAAVRIRKPLRSKILP